MNPFLPPGPGGFVASRPPGFLCRKRGRAGKSGQSETVRPAETPGDDEYPTNDGFLNCIRLAGRPIRINARKNEGGGSLSDKALVEATRISIFSLHFSALHAAIVQGGGGEGGDLLAIRPLFGGRFRSGNSMPTPLRSGISPMDLIAFKYLGLCLRCLWSCRLAMHLTMVS